MNTCHHSGMSLVEFTIYLFLATFLILLSMRAFITVRAALDQQAVHVSTVVKEQTLLSYVEHIVRLAPIDGAHWECRTPERCRWFGIDRVQTTLYADNGLWLEHVHPPQIGKQRSRTEKVLISKKSASFAYTVDREQLQMLTIMLENNGKKTYEKNIILDGRQF